MENTTILKIIIHSKGDESVGIFDETWTICEPISIDNEDIEAFRAKLKEAWEFVVDNATVTFELQGECSECGAVGRVIPSPDQYEGWCQKCAYSDATADSQAYDARTEQLEGTGW